MYMQFNERSNLRLGPLSRLIAAGDDLWHLGIAASSHLIDCNRQKLSSQLVKISVIISLN